MRKNFLDDLKKFLERILDLDQYKIKISHGLGKWVKTPGQELQSSIASKRA
jgi:hypothetical protein